MSGPMLRRLKKLSSTVGPTFRICVLGQSGVGKTALSVRFVTKRFIGEYDPTLENIYQHSCLIGGHAVMFEIMDTAGQEQCSHIMEERIRWADAFILVYAINDRFSFEEIAPMKLTIVHSMTQLYQQYKQPAPNPVVAIVGNKNDLDINRRVAQEDAKSLASSLRCLFYEISARDGFNDVFELFEETYLEWRMTSLNDANGFVKRKDKSFKYVDRIPRMQGSKRSYVINDVMANRLNDVTESTENRPRHRTSSFTRKNDVKSDDISGMTERKTRVRRNAVVAIGNISTPVVTQLNHDEATDVIKMTKSRLPALIRTNSNNAITDDRNLLRRQNAVHCDVHNGHKIDNKKDLVHSQSISEKIDRVPDPLPRRAVSFDNQRGSTRKKVS